jgi:hypothetical protein
MGPTQPFVSMDTWGWGGFPSELNDRRHEVEYSAISSARIGMSGAAPPQPHVFVRRAQ